MKLLDQMAWVNGPVILIIVVAFGLAYFGWALCRAAAEDREVDLYAEGLYERDCRDWQDTLGYRAHPTFGRPRWDDLSDAERAAYVECARTEMTR